MLIIENNWEQITDAIRIAIELVSSFGYCRNTLTSNNALIPIAYYLMKISAKDNFVTSNKNLEDKSRIKKWLVLSLIKRAFSGTPDNVLRPIRNIIKNNLDNFPINNIIDNFKGDNKSLIFSDDDIDNLLHYKFEQGFTFSVLSILYPSLDYRNLFHIDHIFPKSKFTKSKLRKLGIDEIQIEDFQNNVDCIGNLQLLEATPNIEKRDKDFDVWFDMTYKTENEKKDYISKHLIPEGNWEFSDFVEFFEKREELMRVRFKKILQSKE